MSLKFNNEKTRGGQSLQLLKSVLQKSIRLGDVKGVFRAIALIESFHTLGEGVVARIRTNMLNRLRVTYLEDISVANLYGLKWVDKLCEEINSKCRPCVIYKFLYKLCESKKIRFPSYTKNRLYGKCKTEFLKMCSRAYPELDLTLMNDIDFGGSKILKKWWNDKKVIRGKERFLIALHAVFLHFSIGWKEKIKVEEFDEREIKEEWKLYKNGKVTMNIPIHALDKHVSRMKGIDRTFSNFVLCAAAVDNEMDLKWMKAWNVSKNSYLRYNMNKDTDFLTEEDAYNLLTRVQLTCSDNKYDVYLAYNKLNNRRVVVKGPYPTYKEAYSVFKLMRWVSRRFKVKVPLPFIRVLKCNREFFGKEVPLGVRRKLGEGYSVKLFLEFNDIFEEEEVKTVVKNSKLWKEETVLDRDTGLKVSENEELLKNMVRALLIRHLLHLGDFASRNFIVKGTDVYIADFDRLDVSGIESAKFKKELRVVLGKTWEGMDKGEFEDWREFSSFDERMKSFDVWMKNTKS